MSTTIPVAAFQYQGDNRQAVASTDQLYSRMDRLNDLKLGGVTSQFGALGGAIGKVLPVLNLIALGRFALSAVQAADAVGDAAERAGQSVETFSRLQYVAQQSDIEFSDLTNSVRKYQDGLSNAISGTGSMRDALGRLNLSARALGQLPLEEQLARIADRFRETIPQVDKTRVATDLFGKSGQALIPLLNKGSVGIRELIAEADRLGITLDTRAVQALDRGTKAFERFWLAAKNNTASGIGNFFADIFGTGDELTDLEEKYAKLEGRLKAFTSNKTFRDENRIAAITEALDALRPRLQVLRDLQALERGESLSSGPTRRRIDPVHEFKVTLKKIDVDDEAFDSIARRAAEQQLKDRKELNDMLQDGQQDVHDWQVSATEATEKEITKITMDQLEKRMQGSRAVREYDRKEEENLQAQLLNIRQQGALAAETLLTAYGGKFAGVARAILIVEKAMAIKSIVMDTQAAMMKVIKQYGAPWGYALAAGVAVYGAARIAAVASTVAGGDSASSIGSPHNPVSTTPASTDGMPGGGSTDGGGSTVVQLVVNGNVYSGRETVDFFIQQLQDRINQYDTVLINPTSRQARELQPDPT